MTNRFIKPGSNSKLPDLSDKYHGKDFVIEPQNEMQMENSISEDETDESMYAIWKQSYKVILKI